MRINIPEKEFVLGKAPKIIIIKKFCHKRVGEKMERVFGLKNGWVKSKQNRQESTQQ